MLQSLLLLLRADGVLVSSRVPVRVQLNELSRAYLDTKRARMGHIVDAADLEEDAEAPPGPEEPTDHVVDALAPVRELRRD